MAKVKNLSVLCRELKKVGLDYYHWKGIPVVRKMPRKVRQPGTPAQRKTWRYFSLAKEQIHVCPDLIKDAYVRLTRNMDMTWHDALAMVSLQEMNRTGKEIIIITHAKAELI